MNKRDKLSIAMEDDMIRIAEARLNRPLAERFKEKIRLSRWSYMGLEMIIDTVRTIEVDELEGYLDGLDK